MRTTTWLRNLPWLSALVAGCADDTQSTPGDASSESSSVGSEPTISSSGPPDGTGTSTGTSTDTGADTSTDADTSTGSDSSSTGDASDSGSSSSGPAPNVGPTAEDDDYYAHQGEVLDVGGGGVLDNDVDPESDVLVVTAFDAMSARGGNVDVDTNGAFVYTPPPGFFGTDTFGYTASDETMAAMAQVTVHVAPVRAQLAAVELGVGGFMVDGTGTGAGLGYAVASMGDIDGDGLADVLIGAPYGANPIGGVSSGRSYVVFGKSDHDPITLAELEAGSGGFAIQGDFDSYLSGQAVANAGDVNGDGVNDILLGDPYADARGRVHLVFGKADTALVELADVDEGIGGVLIQGVGMYPRPGRGVAGVGDLDADGYADFLIGSPGLADQLGGGQVVFGAPDLGAIDLGDVGAGVRGFAIEGELAFENAGHAVAGLGDVNGDGIGDLGIGAPGELYFYYEGTRHSFVVFGKTDEAPISLGALADEDAGFVLIGDSSGAAGRSISGIGDIDGDGLGDLVIGDPEVGGSGRAYVVFGKTDSTPVDLTQLGDGGFAIEAESSFDALGFSVAGAGDVNGDNVADLVIGARRASPNGGNSGAAYVVYGDPALTAVDLDEVVLGDGGFAIDGATQQDQAGYAVGGAGDVDGDGLADVIVGAYAASDSEYDGLAYVVFGVRTEPR